MVQFDNKGLIEVKQRGEKLILEYASEKSCYESYIREYARVMKIANKFRETKMTEIGKVTSYFNKVGVAALCLNMALKVGDKIKIIGTTTDIEQEVTSMQINNKEVKEAKAKDDVGIKVINKVRKKDKVYIVK